jgi:hypothetical protein
MKTLQRFSVLGVAVSAVVVMCAAVKQPILKLSYDPTIPAVELFDAIEAGQVEATFIPKSAKSANLFVTNKSDRPISVRLPDAVVAVHVLKQGFGQGNNFFGNNAFTATGQQAGINGGGGGGQPVGGGLNASQGVNFNNGFNNNAGNNFFSVPPEKTVQVPLQTVCLAHGKPDPRPQMKYQLVKLEDFTKNEVLQETLKRFAAGDVERPAAQAAAWHLTDSMSWQELEGKRIERAGGYAGRPYFDARHLQAAKELIEQATEETKASKQRVAGVPKL